MTFVTKVRALFVLLVFIVILWYQGVFKWPSRHWNNSSTKTTNISSDVLICEDCRQFCRPNTSNVRTMDISEELLYDQPNAIEGRTDVVTVTPWLAPIVWEGTFDPKVIDNVFKRLNPTIATTVFAVGKYVKFLKEFFETAEQHFMVDFKVHYYVFTDRPGDVPSGNLKPGRRVSVIPVPPLNRWQEISARRMAYIRDAIVQNISQEADYIFCLDVDSKFHARFGVEALGDLVVVIHPGYFQKTHRNHFPYERRPASKACIPAGQGDFYYGGALFGGRMDNVIKLTEVCHKRFEEDAQNNIEAAWQEESHLNRYLLYHKPSKVLSPEYLWQDFKDKTKEVKVIRFSGVYKNYADVRPNV